MLILIVPNDSKVQNYISNNNTVPSKNQEDKIVLLLRDSLFQFNCIGYLPSVYDDTLVHTFEVWVIFIV